MQVVEAHLADRELDLLVGKPRWDELHHAWRRSRYGDMGMAHAWTPGTRPREWARMRVHLVLVNQPSLGMQSTWVHASVRKLNVFRSRLRLQASHARCAVRGTPCVQCYAEQGTVFHHECVQCNIICMRIFLTCACIKRSRYAAVSWLAVTPKCLIAGWAGRASPDLPVACDPRPPPPAPPLAADIASLSAFAAFEASTRPISTAASSRSRSRASARARSRSESIANRRFHNCNECWRIAAGSLAGQAGATHNARE